MLSLLSETIKGPGSGFFSPVLQNINTNIFKVWGIKFRREGEGAGKLKRGGDEWYLGLAEGNLKGGHCTCTQHLLIHRRPSRTCLLNLDSPDNHESCAMLWTTLRWKLFYSEKCSHSWRLSSACVFLQPFSGLPEEPTAEITLPSAAATRMCRETWPLCRRAHTAGTVGCVWEQKAFFLKHNCGLAVVAVRNGMVPSKSVYHNARIIYSQMCKAGTKILYQAIKEKHKTHYMNISLCFETY